MDEKCFFSLPEYTRDDVRENDCSCWIIINNLVYDLTEFFHIHPGGQEVLLEYVCFYKTILNYKAKQSKSLIKI